VGKKKKDRKEEAAGREPGKRGRIKGGRSPREAIREYAKAIGTALVIALLLRQFVFQAFRIPTGSMLETLQIGDFLFVNKFLYGARTPERVKLGPWTMVSGLPVLKFPAIREPRQGDIIVFEFPRDRNLDYIKRCVAVAGDTVRVDDGVLYVNGEIYESNFADRDGDHACVPAWGDPSGCPEPHTKRDEAALVGNPRLRTWPWKAADRPYVVPEGHIFMMGDNRFNSMDSRYWGPLDVDLIKGKAMFIYWSWNGDRHLPRLNRIGDLIR
jgi:signal peptidase I